MADYAILYEDEEFLVANKLKPLPVQADKSGAASLQDLLRAELAAREGREAGAVFLEAAHRVDRRCSGAVVFAKTRLALSTIGAAFRDRRVKKEYLACVEREPEPASGRLEHRLVWDKRRNVVRAAPLQKAEAPAPEGAGRSQAKKDRAKAAPDTAILEYRLAGRSERYFFVEIDLVTGRHHQIRAQFAAAGFPIRGDLKYGARRSVPNGLIMLHARRIVLPQPKSGEKIEVVAPFPESEPLWLAFSPLAEGD